MKSRVRIEHLNSFQKELLDKLWSIDSPEDLKMWLGSLPDDELVQAISLAKLVEIEILDTQIDSKFTAAKAILQKYRL